MFVLITIFYLFSIVFVAKLLVLKLFLVSLTQSSIDFFFIYDKHTVFLNNSSCFWVAYSKPFKIFPFKNYQIYKSFIKV